ncbi:putative asparagine synthetase [glutamine-hydrolyzing] [Camellia lanceoleosa]|uniref:Asparagine synthetase [glutamine-hydrolyzing] n=1 Tax=Camellia lanceoleosa TaxID=1840588 RepID=A0ACC0F198_9ERIC|nr:putative asparagine synthetase [glutamine-hydrolyzing] [Camellia lanceoleosa]
MLGVFSSNIVSLPEELVAGGSRTPSPKTTTTALVKQFLQCNDSGVSIQISNDVYLAYTDNSQSPLLPRTFGVKDEIFCMLEGVLDNLGTPFPLNQVVGHLVGNFAFIVFDKSMFTIFVASDQSGKVPLYWGITADGFLAFADDAELLKGACGKSLASFPQGCFYSTAVGELQSYENPKNKTTTVPAAEEEMWGATFKVEGPTVLAATE